jgi:hypothetical protein
MFTKTIKYELIISKGREKNERLKHQFSQMEGDLDLQEIYNLVSIPKKKTPRKRVVVVKDKNLEGEKTRKNWVDGEVLYLTSLRGELELDQYLVLTFIHYV